MSSGIAVGLVVNATARRVKRRFAGKDVFWREHIPDELVHVTASIAELDDAIADFRTRDVKVVASLGGDGTLHHFAEAIVRHYGDADVPLILPLAGGTMNGLARALGWGMNPKRALPIAIASLRDASPRARALPLIRVSESGGVVRHGFGFATGLIFRAYQNYYRSAEPGMLAAIRASLVPVGSALFGGSFFKGVALDVRGEDGGVFLKDSANAVVASVLEQPLLWFKPFGSGPLDEKSFYVAATAMSPAELAPRLWSVFRGTCRHERLRVAQCRSISIRGQSGYLLDGDLYGGSEHSEIHLQLGRRLRFLLPTPR